MLQAATSTIFDQNFERVPTPTMHKGHATGEAGNRPFLVEECEDLAELLASDTCKGATAVFVS
eukprot:4024869-Heterocapsa_arctica.AAC.1